MLPKTKKKEFKLARGIRIRRGRTGNRRGKLRNTEMRKTGKCVPNKQVGSVIG